MRAWLSLIPFLLVAVVAGLSVYQVGEGEAVLITQFGKVIRPPVLETGIHFKVPVVHQPVRLDLRASDSHWDGQLTSRDRQLLEVEVAFRWQIVDPVAFYESTRTRAAAEARLEDLLRADLRNRLAKMTWQEIDRDRDFLLQEVLSQIRGNSLELGVLVLEASYLRLESTTRPSR